VRILADRHHADLYESLLVLFEDRLGWEVYAPIGLGWADEGLWNYANGHPGVTAQFLGLDANHVLVGDHYEEVWPQHPGRVQKLVTIEQFRAMRWDYLLASVTQHERLWHDLADQIGARSILQVGNVGQPVDWGLSHKVIAAANIAIPDGRGVIYHPEFDTHLYRPGPLTNPKRIVSFMNCLPDAGQAYADWQDLQALLPDYDFREYGILGRDGILGPSEVIGAEMRAAGWAFHNKPQGDGYGFLIHQWASVGRRLIGRASYYRGCLAEPLWDGAVNLDDGIVAAAEVIKAGATAESSRVPDFDAEAEVIREYLA
jgi:hypothetical protein